MRIALQAAVAVTLASVLGSCGKETTGEIVAAKVNGIGISLTEVRAALAQSPSSAPDRALEALIEEELFAQKAVANRLDAHPRVAQALLAARRQILAQAYLQQVIASASAEDAQAVRIFYDEHPELYAGRRVYRLFELAVAAPVQAEALEEQVRRSRHLSDVADWLRARHIAFQLGASTLAAEQLPAESLAALAAMHDGDMRLWRTRERVSVVQLAQSESVPVSEAQARPAIEKQLLARNRLQSATATLKNLRAAAKIEYVMDLGGKTP
jgi:EpsD family peptidyl-prolyl cis-trans isomerase